MASLQRIATLSGHLRRLGLERDLAASDVAEYAEIAGRLASDRHFSALTRNRICARKHRLWQADESADEWARFLVHVADGRPRADLKPDAWPWAGSELHRQEQAANYERGWV